MGTRERDEQAEQERMEQERSQGLPRDTQAIGEADSAKNPVIIDKIVDD